MITEELESLKRAVENLNAGGFEYILTGSMAMSFYSIPRMTRDSDIVIELKERDVERFFEIFNENFHADQEMIKDSVEKNIMFNLFDKKNLFKLDFILKRDDEYENLKFDRKVEMKINGIKLNVISLEDLIISKLLWAKDSESETQLNDIRQLMKMKADNSYINYWIKKLNLENIFSKI
jgi:predicted nucleotidyltransferase